MADVLCGLMLVSVGAVVGVLAAALVRAGDDAGTANRFGWWLGRECWVRPAQRPNSWTHCVIVAVSWKGAVCVRDWGRADGGRWVKKQNVEWRLRFDDPGAGDEAA